MGMPGGMMPGGMPGDMGMGGMPGMPGMPGDMGMGNAWRWMPGGMPGGYGHGNAWRNDAWNECQEWAGMGMGWVGGCLE